MKLKFLRNVLLCALCVPFSALSAPEIPSSAEDEVEIFGELIGGKSDDADLETTSRKAQAMEDARRISCQGGRRVFAYEFQGVLESASCRLEKAVCYFEGKLYFEGTKWKCDRKKSCTCTQNGDVVQKP